MAEAVRSMRLICAIYRARPTQFDIYPSKIFQRGKKTKSRPGSSQQQLPVRLLKDFPAYGRAGNVVAVQRGQMRCSFYPQGLADYILPLELRQMRQKGISFERDTQFGIKVPEDKESSDASESETKAKRKRNSSRIPSFDLQTLPPHRAFDLLDATLPPTLDFYRTPIAPIQTRRHSEALEEPISEVEAISPSPEISPRQVADNIYGSVSTSDIATSIKALLENQDIRGIIQLPDEDISFINIGETDERVDRIKRLGEYEYEIKLKGHEDILRRSVRVLSQNPEDFLHEAPSPAGSSITINSAPAIEPSNSSLSV